MGDHDYCPSRSHYVDTNPTSGVRARGSNPLTRSRALYPLSSSHPSFPPPGTMMMMIILRFRRERKKRIDYEKYKNIRVIITEEAKVL